MSHPNTDRDKRAPERIRVCVRAGKKDWIGVAYSPDAGDPSTIHEYVRTVASAKDAEWALRELADGWIQNNEREGEYGFNRNAQRVLDAIANDAATSMRSHCIETVKEYWQRIQGEDDEGMRELLFGALVVKLENLTLEGEKSK